MIRQLPRITGAFALVLAIAALAYIGGRDSSAQSPFFVPCTTLSVANTAAGAPSDISSSFGIGIGENCIFEPGVDNKNMYNFGGVVNFTPKDWGVKADADVPDGTEIGSLAAQSTLGLLNNPCQNSLNVNFTFYDGTTDETNPIELPPPGTANRMKVLMDDANGNSIPDGAEKWPTYLTELFEVDNNADLGDLHARYFGVAVITQASNLVVILNLMLFEPGGTITDDENLSPDPEAGYPSVTVLQDPTGAASNEDFITDFCSPLLTNATLLANIRTNPTAPGPYTFITAVASSRDADNDGFENQLDTCPTTPNAGDARVSPDPGDADADGIDSACDPDPARGKGQCGFGASNCDEDGDLWANRGDNCVLIANPLQEDDDSDSIGNVCDPNPNDADAQGVQARTCLTQTVQIGEGGTGPVDPTGVRPCTPSYRPPAPGVTATPLPPGTTPRPAGAGGGSGGTSGGVGSGGPSSGIGSLAPVSDGIPLWAAALTAIGALGLVGGGSLMAVRTRKRN